MRKRQASGRSWVLPLFLLAGLAAVLLLRGGGGSAEPDGPTPAATATATPAAVPAGQAPLAGGPDAGFSGGEILDLALRLGLVVIVILGSLYLFRMWIMRGRGPGGGVHTLRVVETLGLGGSRTIYLVDAGNKVLVVGATQGQLTLLSELTDPEFLAGLRAQGEAVAGARLAAAGELLRRTGVRLFRRDDAGAARAAFPTLSQTLARMMQTREEIRGVAATAPGAGEEHA